jgi:hypothetical protein
LQSDVAVGFCECPKMLRKYNPDHRNV